MVLFIGARDIWWSRRGASGTKQRERRLQAHINNDDSDAQGNAPSPPLFPSSLSLFIQLSQLLHGIPSRCFPVSRNPIHTHMHMHAHARAHLSCSCSRERDRALRLRPRRHRARCCWVYQSPLIVHPGRARQSLRYDDRKTRREKRTDRPSPIADLIRRK